MKQTLNRLTILALLLLFTFSQLYLILETIGCTVGALFPLWVVAICLCNWYTTCSKRGLWIGLPLAAALLFAAYRFYRIDLMLQLNDLFDKITGVYMERVAYPGDIYIYQNAADDHSLLFIFLAFLFSSYIGSAITARSGRLLLAMLGGLPFMLACVAVNLHPPIWTIVGLLLFFFLLAAGGPHYADESNAYLAIASTLLPIIFLLGALVFLVRPSTYQYDPAQAPLNQRLSKLSQAIDDWISERAEAIVLPHAERIPDWEPQEQTSDRQNQTDPLWQDTGGGMDLTQSFDEQELDTNFLSIRANRTGTLYLRSVSYGDYAGTSWRPAEDYPGGSSLAYTAEALRAAGLPSYDVSVSHLVASPYRFLPYFCSQAEAHDAFVSSGLNDAYSASFTAFPGTFDSLQVPVELSGEELLYRSFAHDYYTRLPDSTRQTLLALCQQEGLAPGAGDIIARVAQYVRTGAVYDLETQPYPDEDYAVYFLTQSHRGYCIHFATAAAALYRALGIPARIVEGFLVSAEAGKTQDVKGADAHAWVEIYQDGLGWLPVEVTGQSGLRSDALGGTAEQTPPLRETDITPAPSEEFGRTDAVPLTPEPAQQGQMPIGLVTQAALEERDGAVSHGAPYWLLILLTLLFAALPLWRLARRALRYRSFEQADTRRAIVAIYRMAQSASAFGESIPDAIRDAAEKAVFSPHAVSVDEVENCRDQLYIMLKTIYLRLKPWKKFQFKYLRAFL